MARADLLTDLVRCGVAGKHDKFRRTVEAIIAEERAKRHTVLADRLEELLNGHSVERAVPSGNVLSDPNRASSLLNEVVPERTFDELIFPAAVRRVADEVIEEHHRLELLRSYGIEPRNRLLLIGPPGNGKTSFAEALAHALMLPLLTVRYEGVIGTYLGETTSRLQRVWEYVATRRCVLFFDEFETLGKERGDRHETGEIKRVVSSLLMKIDSLPSHVVVVAATNHAELLDRGAWRRFQARLIIPKPTQARLAEWFIRFEQRIKIPLHYSPATLVKRLNASNFAEVEEFGASIFRQYVLKQPDADMKKIIDHNLKGWTTRMAVVKTQGVAKS